MNRLIRSLFALLLAISMSAAHAQGAWKAGPQIPQGANEVIGAVVKGHILVYGGQDNNGPMGIFWDFDPASGQWSKLPSNPVPVHHAATAVVGNTMYVFGGFRNPDSGKTNWWPEGRVWAFDYDKKTWSAMPPLPTARGALSAVAVGSKIYVIGGAGIPKGVSMPDGLYGGGPTDLYGANEMFDTTTKTWTQLRPMSLPRNHLDVAHVDGKIYAIGGRVASCFSGGWSSNVFMNEVYDIATDSWTTRAPMPTARSGTGISVVDGKIHVLGGEGWTDNFGGVFRTHEVFDPKTNTWATFPRMLYPRHGFATATIGRRIYAISGVNNAGGAGPLSVLPFNDVFEF